MQLLPKLIAFLACLLPAGGFEATLSPGIAGQSPALGLVHFSRSDLVQCPVPLPPQPDYVIVNLGESEIDEEDPDTVEKPFAASHPDFDFTPFHRPLPLLRSLWDRTLPAMVSVSSVLRC